MTAIFATAAKILNQIPMSWARCATGRRRSFTILSESMRISKMLLASAKKGAKGKAATKIVMKPNWITVDWKFLALLNCMKTRLIVTVIHTTQLERRWKKAANQKAAFHLSDETYPFPGILQTSLRFPVNRNLIPSEVWPHCQSLPVFASSCTFWSPCEKQEKRSLDQIINKA